MGAAKVPGMYPVGRDEDVRLVGADVYGHRGIRPGDPDVGRCDVKLTKAIKKVSKDTEKVFIRPANFPYAKFKLFYQRQIVGGGIRVLNMASGEPITTFPLAILDGWEEVRGE